VKLEELENRNGPTGKEVCERNHVKGAKRSRGFHRLTTPEYTNEVLAVLGAIELKYDLEMIIILVFVESNNVIDDALLQIP